MKRCIISAGGFFAVVLATIVFAEASSVSPFGNLTYRNIGPTTGRIDAVSGVPGDPETYFAGGLGGLWRSKDGGVTWTPVFDGKPVSSIGAIAVAPSDHRVVYVGTGEPNMRNDIAFGDGVWRSSDGGTTWTHVGLDATSQIAQIAVDPHDANALYVAAVGDPFAPGAARGIYKSTDGGAHWEHVLSLGPQTGASSVVISPSDSRNLFAAMWTVQRRPWMLTSGGPEDGLYHSSDGGAHWTRVTGNGFPSGLTGRIGVAFAPSDPRIVYAVIESKSGVFWRSKDGGLHWQLMSDRHVLDQRPYYFSQFTVDPKRPNHVFFMSIYPSESNDGGKTIHQMDTGGYDHHQMWIDPARGLRAIIGADAGVRISLDGGKTWRDPQLILSQPYHISVDDETPYYVCGEFQDPGAVCGPSMSFTGAITPDQWFSAQSGESGWIVFSPADHNIIYGTGYEEAVIRFDRKAMQARVISPWPDAYTGEGANAYRYRAAWVSPVAVSSLEPNALYFGAQYVMKTIDGGQTWSVISPDLTRNDPTKQRPSGQPVTRDNAGTEVYDTIASIAESPLIKGEIWAGTDDGLVWVTRDGGMHWNNVSANVPGLPKWARIDNVEPSHFDDGTAYIVAENHKLGDRTPYLYMTTDFGAHWHSIVGNLPKDSYARMIREDPKRRGMLYAGTETGLWLTYDGAHWHSILNNLPHAPVYDLVVQPAFDDLVVATHGRGVWILDDVAPLQQWSTTVSQEQLHLFPVRDVNRWNAMWGTWATNEGAGQNPPGDADITFYLASAPPKHEKVSVQIYQGGSLVRTLKVSNPQQGMNRVWWDLMYETVPLVPKYHALQTGFVGPQALPGTYTVRITAGNHAQTGTMTVLPDPRAPGSLDDMRASFDLAMRLRGDFARTGREIIALRALDAAIGAKLPRLAARRTALATAASLRARVRRSLRGLYLANAQSWEDQLRAPSGVYERIANLAQGIIGNDYAPTQGQAQLAASIESALHAILTADDEVFGTGLDGLNASLRAAGLAPIAIPHKGT
jgi:photosystem II stability/assembly factor-like uncharacterized protein